MLTGESYKTSAEMAAIVGPFPKYEENKENMLRVMRNHRRAAYDAGDYEGLSHDLIAIDQEICPEDLLKAAQLSFEKYCSVSKTLEATSEITYSVIVNNKIC